MLGEDPVRAGAPAPQGYDLARAERYDEESNFDKGDRRRHRSIFGAVLDYLGLWDIRFLELGCGTGYFSELLLSRGGDSSGVLIDASSAMLDLATQRLAEHSARTERRLAYFQDIDWPQLECSFDVGFSALAIHHLSDEEKDAVYSGMRRALYPGGVFLLLDLFTLDNTWGSELIEYVSCDDMRLRLGRQLETSSAAELQIERIIERDRAIRENEGDRESSATRLMTGLRGAGFVDVVQVYQEGRIGVWVCRA